MAPKTVKGKLRKIVTGDGRKNLSTVARESLDGKKKKK
jgi:hypothetical protein